MKVLDLFKLDGKIALITGAKRGIGKAMAVALAEAGADVVIAARTAEQLRGTASSIEAVGRAAHLIVADLGDVAQIRSLSDAARAAFGRLDIIVNNVGGAVPQPFMDTSGTSLSLQRVHRPRAFDVGCPAHAGAVLEVHGGLRTPGP